MRNWDERAGYLQSTKTKFERVMDGAMTVGGLHETPSNFFKIDLLLATDGLKLLCKHMQFLSINLQVKLFDSRIDVFLLFLEISCASHSIATALICKAVKSVP